jgi:putative PIN family toxin of toxin-antitoxin system
MIRVTLDTSVLYQALRNSGGASHKILQLIARGDILLSLTVPVFLEYEAVLMRPTSLEDFHLTGEEVSAVLDMLVLVGEKHDVFYLLRPNLPDAKDDIFVECAFVGQSDYLLTSNTTDFSRGEFGALGFSLVTPARFLQLWRLQR